MSKTYGAIPLEGARPLIGDYGNGLRRRDCSLNDGESEAGDD